MLTDKQIEKLQQLYKEAVGEDISKENALLQGAVLIRLMQIIYKPIVKKDYEKLQKIRFSEKRLLD